MSLDTCPVLLLDTHPHSHLGRGLAHEYNSVLFDNLSNLQFRPCILAPSLTLSTGSRQPSDFWGSADPQLQMAVVPEQW